MHKKHKKKFLNILLIPDNEDAPRSFRIRYVHLRLLTLLLGIFVVSIVVSIFTYGKLLQVVLERNNLERENVQLKDQLQKVHQLAAELNKLKSYNQKIRNSLQGYVKFAQQSQDAEGDILNARDVEPRPFSIFSNIPLKAPVSGFISQDFNLSLHKGIDVVAAAGTPIVAAADGVVIFSGWTVQDGYSIILAHGEKYFTYYKHNLKNLVFPLQRVNQGEIIAFLGNSGEKSSGPHLHFEIWKNGNPIDPRSLLVDLN